jgi:colanic acid/amylovoran biosynthesis protein
VGAADLVIVTGMGGVTDAFPGYARDLLSTLGFALRKRRYVAMVGQGFGPLLDPELVNLAREVLPQISLIALREELAGKPLLLSLGVRADRIVTTGDDAIEMAYLARANGIGRCLGVNVRVADYSDVTPSMLSDLREALKEVSRPLSAETISLPISSVPGEADQESIAAVIATDDVVGADPNPDDVVQKIQKCRLVITGSYHAGVFALASGIPVIGLAKSKYYIAKFEGLSAQFGPGCEVVLLSDPDFGRMLKERATALWRAADNVRPLLLKQAARQIEAGRLAYARIKKEVEARLA